MSFFEKAQALARYIRGNLPLPLPASIEPYGRLLELVASGAGGFALAHFLQRNKQDQAKLRLAMFHVIHVIETQYDMQELLRNPQDLLVKRMQNEVMRLIDTHLTQAEGEVVLRELKRKIWKKELGRPAQRRRLDDPVSQEPANRHHRVRELRDNAEAPADIRRPQGNGEPSTRRNGNRTSLRVEPTAQQLFGPYVEDEHQERRDGPGPRGNEAGPPSRGPSTSSIARDRTRSLPVRSSARRVPTGTPRIVRAAGPAQSSWTSNPSRGLHVVVNPDGTVPSTSTEAPVNNADTENEEEQTDSSGPFPATSTSERFKRLLWGPLALLRTPRRQGSGGNNRNGTSTGHRDRTRDTFSNSRVTKRPALSARRRASPRLTLNPRVASVEVDPEPSPIYQTAGESQIPIIEPSSTARPSQAVDSEQTQRSPRPPPKAPVASSASPSSKRPGVLAPRHSREWHDRNGLPASDTPTPPAPVAPITPGPATQSAPVAPTPPPAPVAPTTPRSPRAPTFTRPQAAAIFPSRRPSSAEDLFESEEPPAFETAASPANSRHDQDALEDEDVMESELQQQFASELQQRYENASSSAVQEPPAVDSPIARPRAQGRNRNVLSSPRVVGVSPGVELRVTVSVDNIPNPTSPEIREGLGSPSLPTRPVPTPKKSHMLPPPTTKRPLARKTPTGTSKEPRSSQPSEPKATGVKKKAATRRKTPAATPNPNRGASVDSNAPTTLRRSTRENKFTGKFDK